MQLSKEIIQSSFNISLNLNEDEIKDVIAFMQTLSDTIGLTSKPNKLPNISDSTLNYRIVGGEY